MTSEHLAHRDGIAIERPFSEQISLRLKIQSAVINNMIGIRFTDDGHITIICDKRIPITRENIQKGPKSQAEAGIGVLTLSFYAGSRVFIGDGSEFLIERVSPTNSPLIVEVHHVKPIYVEYLNNDISQMKELLAKNLES